ncbi:MAG: helix-turn-helix domain-containing protein [Clostridia bacterium]|nr:helix-turn-helix domain-containing protein [Clostridia bacterium]
MIRDKLFRMGCPCAAAPISDYRSCLPASLIVTFTDALNTVRQTPMDHIHAIVLGGGFVNSALNASALADENLLPGQIRKQLLKQNGMDESAVTPFGVFGSPDAFFAEDFMEIRGAQIEPTKAEYMIFKYLMSDRSRRFIPPEMIRKYCCSDGRMTDETIAVHISNLNRKSKSACGFQIIESMRFSGYRSAVK